MSQGTVLVVEDDVALRESLCETLVLAGYEVRPAESGTAALELLKNENDIDLMLSDVQMDPMDGIELLRTVRRKDAALPIIMMTAYGTVENAVTAMHEGATDYLVKPFEAEALLDIVGKHIGSVQRDPDEARSLVNEDERSKQLADVARRVAATEATVMITGESGVGKEVISRYIHTNSARSDGPFVAINCAAIPETMLESILFGYEKGAFTGAHSSREGKFEQAQGGTLLLDEITEMDLGLQAKLLRVLQEREVERIGARKTIPLDVRVLATSNRDLRKVVAEGRFREDLFYRLNVFPIHVPALRERRGDILPLAKMMLQRYSIGRTPQLSASSISSLTTHEWPGNVRELDNVIQRALILCTDDVIEREHIQFEQLDEPHPAMRADRFPVVEEQHDAGLSKDMRSHERELIISAMRTSNSRKEVAEALGISPRTLRYKLAKLRDAGFAIPA